jgi:excinuclease ABC subunit C
MSSNIIKLKQFVKSAPQKPGIYFWHNANKQILYVGRATNLKMRLSQYFQKRIDRRISEMVQSASKITWQECDNLLEAIILESFYIKKYWPKYNIVDRDDRSFIYIAIDHKATFPKPILIRAKDLQKFPSQSYKLFGPYQSYHLIYKSLQILRRIFPYSLCKADQGRACFDYQIGLCPGVCINQIETKTYKNNIKNLILFLEGKKEKLLKKLEKENPHQAHALQHIQDVSLLNKEQALDQATLQRIEAYDISHFQGKESYGSMVVFVNGEKDSSLYRLFKIKNAPKADDERALLEVLERRFKHQEWPRPDLLLIDGGSPQISFLSQELAKRNIELPLVGISKYAGDRLVFPRGMKKNFKDMANILKPTLLKTREEAHRFANYGRKRGIKGKII